MCTIEHNSAQYLQMKSKSKKISKGYRLKPETHDLVKSLQEMFDTSTDTIISRACKLYYEQIVKKNSVNKNK